MPEQLTIGSTFTGIGGADLGFEWAGFRVAWQCEFDAWKQQVLRAHWPDVPLYDDITTLHDSSSESHEQALRDGSSWRTYRGSCQAIADETSPDSSMKWSPAGMASDGACSMPVTSAWRKHVGESSLSPVEPTLSSILEPRADSRFELSARAAAGILRRAGRRGRSMPPALEMALSELVRSETSPER